MQQNLSEYQRQKYLKALGIPVWVRRDSRQDSIETIHTSISTATRIEAQPQQLNSEPEDIHLSQFQPSSSQALQPSTTPTTKPKAKPTIEVEESTRPVDCSQMDWKELHSQISSCQSCSLYKYRNKAILGDGNTSAQMMIIGDAPSLDDDRYGGSFQGKTGQLLTDMLSAIDISRSEVYLTNHVKCRPANDRPPSKKELNTCQSSLSRQIDLIKPKAILILGLVSAQCLLQRKVPLSKLREQIHLLPNSNISAVATYHPRYLLKQKKDKRKAWEDLKLFKQLNTQSE